MKIVDGVYKASTSVDFRWEPMPDGMSEHLVRPTISPIGSTAQRLVDQITAFRKKNQKIQIKPLGPELSPESQPISPEEYFRRVRSWIDFQNGDGDTIVRGEN